MQYSLSPDPRQWGANLSFDVVEEDDDLHRPDKDLKLLNSGGGVFSPRGLANLGCVLLLLVSLVTLLSVSLFIHACAG
jgi:hypothetical protein